MYRSPNYHVKHLSLKFYKHGNICKEYFGVLHHQGFGVLHQLIQLQLCIMVCIYCWCHCTCFRCMQSCLVVVHVQYHSRGDNTD